MHRMVVLIARAAEKGFGSCAESSGQVSESSATLSEVSWVVGTSVWGAGMVWDMIRVLEMVWDRYESACIIECNGPMALGGCIVHRLWCLGHAGPSAQVSGGSGGSGE